MEHLPKKICQNGIGYTLVGDYYIPDLRLLEESRPIGSRVKRLAQGELMPCVNSYWVLPDAEIRRFGGFAAAPTLGKINRDWRNGN